MLTRFSHRVNLFQKLDFNNFLSILFLLLLLFVCSFCIHFGNLSHVIAFNWSALLKYKHKRNWNNKKNFLIKKKAKLKTFGSLKLSLYSLHSNVQKKSFKEWIKKKKPIKCILMHRTHRIKLLTGQSIW